MKTSPRALDELVQKALDHKHDVQLTLLKQEYQRTQEIQRQKMLANLEGDKGERPKVTDQSQCLELCTVE